MKRKIIVCIILISLLISSLPASMQGVPTQGFFEPTDILNIISFFDGSHLIEMKPVVGRASSASVTGSKNYYYLDGDGNISWDAVITGTFTFNGTTSYCTASSCTTTVYSGNWREAVNNASYAGNAAFASVTMELRFIFIVIKTENLSLTLTCDASGNLS